MENQFRFYNTLTRKIETVIPHEDGKIKMYTCGPTVYHLRISGICVPISWRIFLCVDFPMWGMM